MSHAIMDTGIGHGDVVVLSPSEPVDAPIIRDSAEALVAQVTGSGARGILPLAAIIGAAGLGVIAWHLSSPVVAGAVVAICAALLFARHRTCGAYAVVSAVAAGGAAGWAVADAGVPATATGVAWIAATSVLMTLTVAAAAAWLSATMVRSLVGLITACVIALCASLGFGVAYLSGTGLVQAPAALATLGALAVFAIAPGMATTLAGLEVFRLPTAGQDLSYSDSFQPDVDLRARRARMVADGMASGAGVVLVVALACLGFVGGLAVQLCALAVAGATVVHAARHRSPAWAWALGLSAITALSVVTIAPLRGDAPAHPVHLVLAGCAAVACASAPLWLREMNPSPTTLAWWERAEMAALVATIPLAAWVAGVFALVRGLG
ncbi:type VII secretion integral membrane protein EccD [Corynebacterium tapiri]